MLCKQLQPESGETGPRDTNQLSDPTLPETEKITCRPPLETRSLEVGC